MEDYGESESESAGSCSNENLDKRESDLGKTIEQSNDGLISNEEADDGPKSDIDGGQQENNSASASPVVECVEKDISGNLKVEDKIVIGTNEDFNKFVVSN